MIIHDVPKPDPQPKKIRAGKAEWRAYIEACRVQKKVDELIDARYSGDARAIKAQAEALIREAESKAQAHALLKSELIKAKRLFRS